MRHLICTLAISLAAYATPFQLGAGTASSNQAAVNPWGANNEISAVKIRGASRTPLRPIALPIQSH